MIQSSNVAKVMASGLLFCSAFFLISCSERKPAGSDRPKTKEKTLKGTDLEIFKDNKKADEKANTPPTETKTSE